jgi:methionyl-tRNA synthetase
VNTITYDYFSQIDLKVATIEEAKPHPNADRLVILQVSLGEEKRQIVAGIREHYPVEQLAGKQIVIVTNLEPRTIRGEQSHGMLLAASNDKEFALLAPDKTIAPGSKIG